MHAPTVICSSQITFTLRQREFVTLTVWNTLGQEVGVLVRGVMDPGPHTVSFDGFRFSSGVYYCRLAGKHAVITRAVVLAR